MSLRTETHRTLLLDYIFSHTSVRVGLNQVKQFLTKMSGNSHEFNDFHKQTLKLEDKLSYSVYQEYMEHLKISLIRLENELDHYEDNGLVLPSYYKYQCYETFAREYIIVEPSTTQKLFCNLLNNIPLQCLYNSLMYICGVAMKTYNVRLVRMSIDLLSEFEKLKKHLTIISNELVGYIVDSFSNLDNESNIKVFEVKNKFLLNMPKG